MQPDLKLVLLLGFQWHESINYPICATAICVGSSVPWIRKSLDDMAQHHLPLLLFSLVYWDFATLLDSLSIFPQSTLELHGTQPEWPCHPKLTEDVLVM